MRAVVPSPVTATDSAWPQTRGATPPTRVTARANLEHSLPFLVAGVLMVGVGAWFGISHLQPAGSRGAFWLLVVGLGVTLTGGGLALTLSEPPDPASGPTPYGDYVLVPRGDWVRWQQEGFGVPSGPPAPPAPAETPVWQETEPEAPASQTVAAPATPAARAPPSAPEVPGAPTYPATSLRSPPHRMTRTTQRWSPR